ncbi:septal ring factor EnvC (AmiA/AmiB activator) [Maritalea mobilis]|uniref:Septal ring factor EnvC (AmiA/AmiB activator) n=1 Tax=Maritalea mobilis TaxID=483324 RepID=A0A4R6VKQ2_9HYPH|nr:peptidoglycan DD-metalloendopeptidase family protein [Maritalea mobilis]TDQ64239.1 septal ring factor EnvC (AmiA/AmiB activator) [Maritalea mobilis]
MRQIGKATRLSTGILLLSTMMLVPSLGQFNDPTTTQDAQIELDQVKLTIELTEERVNELKAQVEELSGDRTQQTAALIESAQRVKLAEIEASAIAERLAGLRAEEETIRATLDDENQEIGTLLTALQQLGRNPPPALIIEPGNAVNSARAGSLLASVLPQLASRADAVRLELDALLAIAEEAEAEQKLLVANLTVLREERLRIATLIEARKRGLARVNQELDAEQREAELLASRATSLTQLIKTLEDKVQSVSDANAEADAADAAQSNVGEELEQSVIDLALADKSRTEPAFPFALGKGHLTPPVVGVEVVSYGADDRFGGTSQGAYIVTRAEAQIVAPADGWVVYKGPYLNYGQIIILNMGQGYHLLLAGMESADVALGQFVLMGEPLGKMGERTNSQTIATSAGNSRPTLYIEIRNEDTPIDPTGWWDKGSRTAQNG